MALPGTVLEGRGPSCDAFSFSSASKLLLAALGAVGGCGEHLVCASLLLQRADSEACYDVTLRSMLAHLKKSPQMKEDASRSPWTYLDTLCKSTMGRVPDDITALESSAQSTIDVLSAAVVLSSAVFQRQRATELVDDLWSQFWNKWVEHQLDTCSLPEVGSVDLGVVWEGWVRCHVILRSILAVRMHVGALLDDGQGGQEHADRWLCVSNGLGKMATTLASSTPGVLHLCYQQWLAEDDRCGHTEGVGEELTKSGWWW